MARELGMGANLLTRWKREAEADGQRAFGGTGSARDEETARLKRELARVKKERDSLRDAATLSHYQFEAIHPFYDGNGRTGRILNVLQLIEQGLLTLPILYLSRYLLQNKAEYYRLLRQVTREGQWEAWILFMLAGVEQVSRWTCQKIAAVRALLAQTSEHVRRRLPRIHSHELLQVLFEQPYCRISSLVERDIAKRQTASVYLKRLVEIGALAEEPAGKEKLFVHTRLVRLMSEDSYGFPAYPGV